MMDRSPQSTARGTAEHPSTIAPPNTALRQLKRSLDRVETERAHVEEKRTAFDQFARAVREIQPIDRNTTTAAGATGGTTAVTSAFDPVDRSDRRMATRPGTVRRNRPPL